ncbi:cobalamin-dependent protein, partial [Acidimicrobium ferrooxidans]|nr:cobalamin-dependent protein [Acidimicrobium ferrooxidans]
MKVLFVYPEHYLCVGIPGGIAVLSAVLKNLGHEVELFDTAFLKTQKYYDAEKIHQAVHGGGGGTSDKGGIAVYKSTEYTIEDLVKDDPLVDVIEVFQAKIDAFEPDVIALSCMTSIFDYACSLVKAVTHDAVVVVGGVHATIAADDCMTQPCIDYAFVGDGDICFPEFLDKLEKGENVKTVASLVYRDLFGQVQKNPLAPRIDLDTLPCPDWGLFDERHLFRPYEGNIYKGSFYSQSRGCPMQCTYCVDPVMSEVTGGRAGYFRVQKPETTVAHLAELKEKFGATWFR